MSQGGFQRTYPLGDGFLRVPGRILIEPITALYPPNLSSIINITPNLSTYVSDVQTATMGGAPTGGTFTLSFLSYTTSALAYNSTAAQVQTALLALPGIGYAAGGTPNVTCTGGPFPSTPITITFTGTMAQLNQPLILVPSSLQALTGGTSPGVTIAHTTPGNGLYDPVGSWTELGSTKSGIHIDRNNTETMIDVDQILQGLIAIPDEWEMTCTSALAETTEQNLQIMWEGDTISLDATQTVNESHLPLGAPLAYTQRRMALVAQKAIGPSANRIRAVVFRNVTRSPVSSRLTYDKTGPQQTIPFTFRAFADQNIADPSARFGEVIEQIYA